jgi:hypothetical protein
MASAEPNFFGSLYQIKLSDDVTNLLSTPVNVSQQKLIQNSMRQQQQQQQQNYQFNATSTPSTSRLSTNSTLSATSNDTVTTSFSTNIDLRNIASKKFEEQIKYLDKQAKELQYQMNNSTSKMNEISIGSTPTPSMTPILPKNPPPPLPNPQLSSSIFDPIPVFINSTSSSSMRNTADIKDEETFYEKIKYA